MIGTLEEYYRNLILLVLHGCETWRLTLREENRLKVLREYGAEEEGRGNFCGEDYIERSCVVCERKYLGGQIKKNWMGGACSRFGEQERCLQGLMGRPEGKTLLERPRRR